MRILLVIAAGAAAVAVEKRRGRVSSPPLPPQKVPVIGILAQPSTRTPFKQYVASSYVKWVEMAGGVAVPLSYVATNATTLNLLKQLDGVLLPGGSNPPLPDAARVSVEYALEASSRNESFPVWGTCLGFEWLVEILAPTQRETINLNLTRSRRWRLHDHMSVDASRGRTEATSRRRPCHTGAGGFADGV
jgi:gamma-glutamyl-gamma-aminobutyrate hydrolase PuuD